MSYYLGATSKKRLKGVHPDLVRVVERAIELTPIDFGVTEGLRTLEKQQEYFNTGKSTTMNSKHLPVEVEIGDGAIFGLAVDLYCCDDQGKVTWEHKWFRLVIQAMFTAAIELGIQIRAGGLWRTFLDSPHFELAIS